MKKNPNDYSDPRFRRRIPWFHLIFGLSGLALGFLGAELVHLELLTTSQVLQGFLATLVSMFLTGLICPLGHLAGGLHSGYDFLFFRLGPLALCLDEYPVDENGDPIETEFRTDSEETSENQEESTAEAEDSDNLNQETVLAAASSSEISAQSQEVRIETETIEIPEETLENPTEDEDESSETSPTEGLEPAEKGYMYVHRDWSVKKMKLSGGLGQCSMVPPRHWAYQDVEVAPYLLGGGLANLISIPVFWIPVIFFHNLWWMAGIFTCVALFSAMIKLIPMKLSGTANDGYTAKLCKKDPISHAAFVYELHIAHASLKGVSVGDMPETWFYGKFSMSERMTSNPLIAKIWNDTGDRFLIHGELFQAKIVYEAMSRNDGVSPLMQQIGVYSYLYTLILEGRVEEARLYPIPKHMKKSAEKLSRSLPLFARYQYGYAQLVSENGKNMKIARGKLDKISEIYPYIGALQDEETLIERLDDVVLIK